MAFLRALMRVYAYIYFLLISFIFLALAVIAYQSGSHNLRLEMLPWTGETLSRWLLGLGLAGVFAILLAATGWFRFLFPFFALYVTFLMFRGLFASSYSFDSRDAFVGGVWLWLGAAVAFLCSLLEFKGRSRKRSGVRVHRR